MKKIKLNLTVKIFLLLILFVVIPMNIILFAMKKQFENYITEELNERIAQTLVKSEDDLYAAFDQLSNLSNLIISSEVLKGKLAGEQSYYEKTKAVDTILNEFDMTNVYNINKMQVTIIDKGELMYSNWGMNYHDYSFLKEKEFVKKSRENEGYIQWAVFSESFIVEEKNTHKYVGLARSILSNGVTGENLGTLIISMNQSEISKILEKYLYNVNDCVYVCDDQGDVIMRLDNGNHILNTNEDMPYSYYKNNESEVVEKIKGNQYLICNYDINRKWTMNGKGLSVYYFTDYQSVTKQFREFTKQINILIVLTIVVLISVIYILAKTIVRPIRILSKQMDAYDMNLDDKNYQINIIRQDEIGRLNRSFYHLHDNINELFGQVKKEQKIKEHYRMDYLKAQLNPHFLFNTLGTIRWMAIIKKAENIVETIDALGNMLKYSMGKGDELVSLEEEIDNLKGYVNIQNARYGNVCRVCIDVEEDLLKYKLLRFILQPVVENAIIHGFKEIKQENIITIKAKHKQDKLEIYIEDNGRGLDELQMEEFNSKRKLEYKKFNKIGVQNVDEQIMIQFGKEYGLHFEKRDAGGTKVIFVLPIIKNNEGVDNEEGNDC